MSETMYKTYFQTADSAYFSILHSLKLSCQIELVLKLSNGFYFKL